VGEASKVTLVAAPSDFSLVGTVLAVSVAILILSGLALYVAFRVRETLREGKGKSGNLVKVAFLVGLLFLSGGAFYYFAGGFGTNAGGTTQTTNGGTSVSTSSSTTVTSTSSTGGIVTWQVTYPSTVTFGKGFYVQVSVYNSGSAGLSSGSLDLGNLGAVFTVTNATACNPGCSSTTWTGSAVQIGELDPGQTTLNIGLRAPSSPTQFSGEVVLNYQGEPQPLTQAVTIKVSGGP